MNSHMVKFPDRVVNHGQRIQQVLIDARRELWYIETSRPHDEWLGGRLALVDTTLKGAGILLAELVTNSKLWEPLAGSPDEPEP
jgi:hypothetical protein